MKGKGTHQGKVIAMKTKEIQLQQLDQDKRTVTQFFHGNTCSVGVNNESNKDDPVLLLHSKYLLNTHTKARGTFLASPQIRNVQAAGWVLWPAV